VYLLLYNDIITYFKENGELNIMSKRVEKRTRVKNGKRQYLNENNRWTNEEENKVVSQSEDSLNSFNALSDFVNDDIINDDPYQDKTIKDLKASDVEKYIESRFKVGSQVFIDDKDYTVTETAKPSSGDGGEGKTDVYVALKDDNDNVKELKISIKKYNAGHWENKISTDRFNSIFKDHPEEAVKVLDNISQVIKEKRTAFDDIGSKKKSVTLGFRLDAVQKPRVLSTDIKIHPDIQKEILSGANLSDGKRDSYVNGKKVEGSGVANYLLKLEPDDSFEEGDDVIDKFIPIDDYVDSGECPMYFSAAAVNDSWSNSSGKYKYENRPLLAYYDLNVDDQGELQEELIVDHSLTTKSKDVRNKWSPSVIEAIAKNVENN
jgi:hypothetical protein